MADPTQVGMVVKEPACQCRGPETRLQPLRQEDSPGGRHGNPSQYSRLKNPMDREGWRAKVHKVAKLDMNEVT